ncbi:hypothetical protein [Bacillus paramycoides]|nr:hypothetical protein [Bacillus paramycoides]
MNQSNGKKNEIDDFAFVRGCKNALFIVLPFWIAIVIVILEF